MLENLRPADKVQTPKNYRPGVEFDGTEGTATTPGYASEPENFDEFLRDAGLDPSGIDVIPPVRTSRWQQQKDGELIWLTSYRFTFRQKTSDIDLPLLLDEARKKLKPIKLGSPNERAMVILWSDLQVGKTDYRGNTSHLLERVALIQERLIDMVTREKPEKVLFVDTGDTVENFYNANAIQQAMTNDLSIMEQVDLATSLAYQTLKRIAQHVTDITYISVGSNHCQFRMNGKTVGKPTDDWGVFIGRQIARLSQESGQNWRFIEPQPHEESLAVQVWDDDQTHVLGVVHGHQASRPEAMADWWRKQSFGRQPVADATLLVHGHWHHLRITELGSTPHGTSRFLVMAPTMDNGSNWFRMRSGEDSIPGLATLILEKGKDYTGTVHKL
jgi:hypothetical protein